MEGTLATARTFCRGALLHKMIVLLHYYTYTTEGCNMSYHPAECTQTIAVEPDFYGSAATPRLQKLS